MKEKIEHYKEHCEYCGCETEMFYTTHKIEEYEDSYKTTKHEFTIRQCSECKMIQPQED